MGDMYKKSGVNLQETEMLNNRIKPVFSSENSLAFAGSAVSDGGVKILTCCDGIGSKIIPLYERKMYKEIAVDLIAANLNDLATRPANAISFQDYIAVNKLDSYAVAEIIIELERELKKYGCRLTGGETSEVPHLLREGVIDICGFAVGIEKNLTVQHVEAGDVVIGLKSSGIHANGFTLIRKFLDEDKISNIEFEEMLVPAYVYFNEVQTLWDSGLIKAAANITGGGIFNNLIRVIPENLDVELDYNLIPTQPVFKKLKMLAGDEVYEVFNCGAGFCVIAREECAAKITEICREYEPFIFGKVVKADKEAVL